MAVFRHTYLSTYLTIYVFYGCFQSHLPVYPPHYVCVLSLFPITLTCLPTFLSRCFMAVFNHTYLSTYLTIYVFYGCFPSHLLVYLPFYLCVLWLFPITLTCLPTFLSMCFMAVSHHTYLSTYPSIYVFYGCFQSHLPVYLPHYLCVLWLFPITLTCLPTSLSMCFMAVSHHTYLSTYLTIYVFYGCFSSHLHVYLPFYLCVLWLFPITLTCLPTLLSMCFMAVSHHTYMSTYLLFHIVGCVSTWLCVDLFVCIVGCVWIYLCAKFVLCG